jgi:hypothetical protein
VQKQQRDTKKAGGPQQATNAERERRGQQAETPAEKQLGATEREVTPLTPPMARSDEQPNDPDRGDEPSKGIDPADELTPG